MTETPYGGLWLHLTPVSRLPQIKRQGLRLGRPRTLRYPEEEAEFKEPRGISVFELGELSEILEQAKADAPEITRWAVLKLDVPRSWIRSDPWGFRYSKRSIPASRIVDITVIGGLK